MPILTTPVKIGLAAVGGFIFARIVFRLEPYFNAKIDQAAMDEIVNEVR